jgi:hypothetical protein
MYDPVPSYWSGTIPSYRSGTLPSYQTVDRNINCCLENNINLHFILWLILILTLIIAIKYILKKKKWI